MPQFKNKEEYEKWKAERSARPQDDNRIIEEAPKTEPSPVPPITTAVTQKKCKHCAMMIPKEAKLCPYCRKKQGLSVLEKAGLIIISFIVLFTFIGYLIAPSSQKTTSIQKISVSLGEEGVLNSGTELTPLAIDKTAFDEWTKARVVKDEQGMTQLIMQGRIISIDRNTKVKVIDTGTFIRKVRILDGKHQGMAGWVAYEYVQKRGI